jgi:8-oxo-dGTP diphosphatase
MTKLEMVVGFLFERQGGDNYRVLLVEKKRPPWQEGLLNGVGGKVEVGESPLMAMHREFVEETGIKDAYPWRLFCVEIGRDYVVNFFSAFVDELPKIPEVNDKEAENLVVTRLEDTDRDMVGNLRWLIPMACDWRAISNVIVNVEHADIREHASW